MSLHSLAPRYVPYQPYIDYSTMVIADHVQDQTNLSHQVCHPPAPPSSHRPTDRPDPHLSTTPRRPLCALLPSLRPECRSTPQPLLRDHYTLPSWNAVPATFGPTRLPRPLEQFQRGWDKWPGCTPLGVAHDSCNLRCGHVSDGIPRASQGWAARCGGQGWGCWMGKDAVWDPIESEMYRSEASWREGVVMPLYRVSVSCICI